jgi:phosphatidate cytidylyltransferase
MVRLVAGAVLAAAAFSAVRFLPDAAFRLAVCVVAALAAREYARVADSGAGLRRWVLVAAVVATCWGVSSGRTIAPVLPGVALLAWVTVEMLWLGSTIQQSGALVLGLFYIGLPLGFIPAIRTAVGWPGAALLLAVVIVSDSAQYYVGRALGRHRLAASISPNKTAEGALGGVVAASLLMGLVGTRVFPWDSAPVLASLGALLAGAGICGDLVESRLKRTAGLKDSASLIPGHGGVLDRIDALLFVSPALVAYLYFQSPR